MADLPHPPLVFGNPKQDSSACSRMREYTPICPTGEQHILGCEQSHTMEPTGRGTGSASVLSHPRTRELVNGNACNSSQAMTTYSVKSLAHSDVKEEVQRKENDPVSNFWDRFTSSTTTLLDSTLLDSTPFGGPAKLVVGAAKVTGTAAKRGKHLMKGSKGNAKMDLEGDFKAGFLSTCEAVDKRLRALDYKYGLSITQELDETRKQFKDKQIFISVLGCQNIGKSTLLNSLLRARLLPAKEGPETGPKVLIQHNQELLVQSMASATREPILHLKYAKQQPEMVKGAAIYRRLETLNTDVRNGDKCHKDIPKCTLVTCVPFLADAPPEWKVSLVDTPGFGEFESRVESLATEALKCSSAYVYITTYADLHTKANADYLKFIYQRDQGVFEDNRLIIVITKFDLVHVSQSEDYNEEEITEEITEEKAKAATCLYVSKVCQGARISAANVIPVSGRWAFHARMLARNCQHESSRRKCRQNVERCLAEVPSPACGQEERPSTRLEDNELSAKLEIASGIANLEVRIQTMTKSCVKIWVSKMKGDYERYLKQTIDKLSRASRDLSLLISSSEETLKSKWSLLKAIDVPRKELDESIMLHKNSPVYMCIAAKYPEDLKISKPQQNGRRVVGDLVTAFRDQCLGKVKDKRVEFGPHQLETDLKGFLEKVTVELEEVFNNTCAFPKINQLLMQYVGEMTAEIERMRGNAWLLCTSQQKTTLQRATTIPNKTGASEEKAQESFSESQEDASQPLVVPSLGFIKEKVQIPLCITENTTNNNWQVSLSIWTRFAQYCSAHSSSFLAFWRRRFKRESTELKEKDHDSSELGESKDDKLSDPQFDRATEPTETASYRVWSSELENLMRVLQDFLEEECETYFVNIKKRAVKYFYGQYCYETRTRLASFDAEFKEDIDKQRKKLKKLEKTTHHSHTELVELDSMRAHMVTLAAHLDVKADQYLQFMEWKKGTSLLD